MAVTGVIVKTIPEKLQAVHFSIENIKEVSITRIMDRSKVLAIIECNMQDDGTEITDQIRKIDGVIGINLAYHHFEK
jgi:nitrate reductase NapAB chaperone NapD